MKVRLPLSPDLAAIRSFLVIVLAVALLMEAFFPVIPWLRHPTALAWLWALGVATATSLFGLVLLFRAKLPQYRAGHFFRVGSRDLPPRGQRLYRTAFWLIVPSIIVLLALLSAVHRFP